MDILRESSFGGIGRSRVFRAPPVEGEHRGSSRRGADVPRNSYRFKDTGGSRDTHGTGTVPFSTRHREFSAVRNPDLGSSSGGRASTRKISLLACLSEIPIHVEGFWGAPSRETTLPPTPFCTIVGGKAYSGTFRSFRESAYR